MGYTQVELSGLPLKITNINVVRVKKTKKQILGKTLSELNIIGKNEYQKNINITGVILATDSNTLLEEKNLLLYLDNLTPHVYEDGVNDGIYYIEPESIRFTDTGDEHFSVSRYTMSLIEK